MKITRITLEWYRQQQRVPSWAKEIASKSPSISIDAVLNSQAGITRSKYDHDFTKLSFINLCRIVRKRKSLIAYLEELVSTYAEDDRGRKYRIYAKRWLRKINKNKIRNEPCYLR